MSLLFHPWWQISLRLSIQISIIHGWINSWTESSRAPEKEIYLTRTLLGGTYINSELGHFRDWDSQNYYLLKPGAVTSAFMDRYTSITKLYRIQDKAQCTCDSAFLKLSVRAREMLLSPKAWSCDPCLGPGATLPPLINQCTCKYICSILCTHNKLNKFVKFLQK